MIFADSGRKMLIGQKDGGVPYFPSVAETPHPLQKKKCSKMNSNSPIVWASAALRDDFGRIFSAPRSKCGSSCSACYGCSGLKSTGQNSVQYIPNTEETTDQTENGWVGVLGDP